MIKSIKYATLLLGVTLLCGAGVKKCGLNFSHEKHLGFGLECADCHTAKTDGGYEHPTMQTCATCHDEVNSERGSQDCLLCHTDGDNYKIERTPAPKDLKEIHGFHASKECTTCHTNIYASNSSEDNNYPKASTCWLCHKNPHEGIGDHRLQKWN
ncbi:MAG: hypothetical protein A3F16_06300 [Deltaproteobacteria bacterium RIFCSPHIGHO2_12_FULL_43_9]|nr:MAG: hypothetical protein A3F16_06300 [Deltaproteobacteria bacterium RIFCSPHIGHO2_12_FULL_43_9]